MLEHRGNRSAVASTSLGAVARVGLLARSLSMSARSNSSDRLLLRRGQTSFFEIVESVEKVSIAANVVSAMQSGGGRAGAGAGAGAGSQPQRLFSKAKTKLKTEGGRLSVGSS